MANCVLKEVAEFGKKCVLSMWLSLPSAAALEAGSLPFQSHLLVYAAGSVSPIAAGYVYWGDSFTWERRIVFRTPSSELLLFHQTPLK